MENKIVGLEKALIGALLSNEKTYYDVKGRIFSSDFFDKRHALIFDAIDQTYDKGYEDVELPPILSKLEFDNTLENAGGKTYLAELISNPGLKSNVNGYINEIVNSSQLRKIKKSIRKITNNIDEARDPEDILEKVEMDILETARGTEVKGFVDSTEGVEEAFTLIEKKLAGEIGQGILSGFDSFDEQVGGFQKGDLVIVAARPSMGKSAFAINIAKNMAKNKNVAFFSLEMPTFQIWNRLIAQTAFIDQNKIKNPKPYSKYESDKLESARTKLKKLNLFIDDTAGIKLGELEWKAKRLKKNKGLDAIFIDYLQLIVGSTKANVDRQAEVSTISRRLKKLARDLEVPVIALSQLSRKVESRENKTPMMSDLRESGAIEQDADLITFLYRDAYYNRDDEEAQENDITKVIIAKHRQGSTGEVELKFNGAQALFIDKGEE